MPIVADYLNTVLLPDLTKRGLPGALLSLVAKDVGGRLESALAHWRETPYRDALFALGIDEPRHYRPAAPEDVRALVVVGVRNSVIEDLHIVRPYTRVFAGHAVLNDASMPTVTGTAVRFFAAARLDEFEAEPVAPEADLWGRRARRFPVAWEVLGHLGALSRTIRSSRRWQPQACAPYPLDALSSGSGTEAAAIVHVSISGMDPGWDPQLADLLQQVARELHPVSFFPAFKSLSRNPEKLLHAFKIIMSRGMPVVTLNAYLRRGFVVQRRHAVRVPHTTPEIVAAVRAAAEHSARDGGFVEPHHRALQLVARGMRGDGWY
jgi:hypothetical protein